jgi:hypothetical protein
LFQPPGFKRGLNLLDALAPLRFQFRIALLANKIKDCEKVIPLLFELVKAVELPFDVGLTSSGFGSLTRVVPKFRLGGLPLEFFQFRC